MPFAKPLASLLFIGLSASDIVIATETIPLYTDYADPPFSVAAPDSLTRRLATALTAHSDGRYRFEAMQLPRKRMNLMLQEASWPGVVAWANPAWFHDEKMSRFRWSHPYMKDADLLVSSRSQPVEYENNGASLAGLVLGGIAGQRYVDVEPLIQAHKLTRDDAASEVQSLQKLKLGRVQVAFAMKSSMPYLHQALPDFDRWAYVSRNPRAVYQRYFFASQANGPLIDFLDVAMTALRHDPAWQSLLGGE